MQDELPLVIEKAISLGAILSVERLANEIWNEHFTPIIGAEQVAYMLNKFQSAEAIGAQRVAGYCYYLVQQANADIGYMATVPDVKNNTMMLSKLYVKKRWRGAGVGKRMLDIVEQECIDGKLETLWLTVNRLNTDTIAWYERRGFVNKKPIKKNIGAGFFMDDYMMKKQIV